MSQVNFSSTSSVSFGELGPTTSLQLMFAKLQLELAQTAKTQAMDKMDAIASAQDEQKLVSQLLNEARQAKADANSGVGNDKEKTQTYELPKKDANGNEVHDAQGNVVYETVTETVPKGNNATFMSQEMVDYMDAHGLAYDKTGNNHSHSADEWDVASSRQTGRRHPPQGASMSQITEQEKDIQSALLDMAKAAGFTEKEFHTIQAALEKGATLADVFNISKDTLESGYAYAYNLYKAGNYKDAESMFRGLCMYDGDDPRYWMGLAGCLQAREAWQQAIDTYGMAGVAGGLKDPAPFYYGGLCYLKLGDGENAAASFRAALGLGDASIPAHKAVHDRIRALLATLSQSKE